MTESLKCKVGDLAVVVDSFNKSNIGKIVRVVDTYARAKVPWMVDRHDFFDWIIECPTVMVWSGGKGTRTYRRKRGPAPDYSLQPIRGDEAPEQLVQIQTRPRKRKVPLKNPVLAPTVEG